MDKFTLINKKRSRIKVFEPFEDVSKPSPSIDAIMISYGCVYKRNSRPVMKGSRVETIEAARKEYAKLLKEGWKKTYIFRSYFQYYFYMEKFIGFTKELWLNQPNAVIGVGVMTLVFLGIYIKLLDIYQ